jgi:hypothetical protein
MRARSAACGGGGTPAERAVDAMDVHCARISLVGPSRSLLRSRSELRSASPRCASATIVGLLARPGARCAARRGGGAAGGDR